VRSGAPKTCNISESVQLGTKVTMTDYMCFQLAPKSTTLDDQDCGTVYQESCVYPRHSQASRDNCFVLALAPDTSMSTRLPCLAYINVPLSTYCKIRRASKFTAASRSFPYDSTAFLFARLTGSRHLNLC